MFVLMGCSGTRHEIPAAMTSAQPTANTVRVALVTNKKYGFRLGYPDGWVSSRWEKSLRDRTSIPARLVLAYADPKGAQADNGAYLDAEQVTVFELSRALDPKDLTQETAGRIVSAALADLPGLDVRSKELKRVDVHGATGWQVNYEYEVGAEVVGASSVLVVKGVYAYWVTLQASTYTWHEVSPTLSTCLRYFKLL